jgi:hypothetical protein
MTRDEYINLIESLKGAISRSIEGTLDRFPVDAAQRQPTAEKDSQLWDFINAAIGDIHNLDIDVHVLASQAYISTTTSKSTVKWPHILENVRLMTSSQAAYLESWDIYFFMGRSADTDFVKQREMMHLLQEHTPPDARSIEANDLLVHVEYSSQLMIFLKVVRSWDEDSYFSERILDSRYATDFKRIDTEWLQRVCTLIISKNC